MVVIKYNINVQREDTVLNSNGVIVIQYYINVHGSK